MFTGEYKHTTDDKGRLTIPSKLRESFLSGLMVTRGLEHCLFIYTTEGWKTVAERLRGASQTKKSTRSFMRFFLSGAYELIPDGQGRILLPAVLREFASIGSDVVITGAGDHLEVWSPEEWQKVIEEAQENAEEIAEALEVQF